MRKFIILFILTFSFLFANNELNISEKYEKIFSKNKQLQLENKQLKKEIINLKFTIKKLTLENKQLKKQIAKINEPFWKKINFFKILEVLVGLWLILFIYFYLRKKFDW